MSQTVKCEICGFENPVEYFYCGRCGNNLGTVVVTDMDSLVNAPIEGERKHVTIIFADISGFTALNDAAKSPAEVEQASRDFSIFRPRPESTLSAWRRTDEALDAQLWQAQNMSPSG